MGYLVMNAEVDESGQPCTECGKPVENDQRYYFDREPGARGESPWPVVHMVCLMERVEREQKAVQA